MPSPNEMLKDFDGITRENGVVVRFRYFTASGANAGYDDAVALTRSGNDIYTSGLWQPIQATRGSNDAVLMEQGRVFQNDSKLYVRGTINTSGLLKIGFGSPTGQEYAIITDGIIPWIELGSVVYKKCYVRALPTGSLYGE